MSLTALIQEAGVPLDVAQAQPVVDTIVSPTNEPSSTIPVPDAAVAEVAPELVVAPAPVVDGGVPEGYVPVEAVTEAVVDVQAEALQAEQCALQDKADELLDVQHSMESLDRIIRSTGFKGIGNQTAEILQVQLRAAQRKLGITTAIGSMESFQAKDQREQHAIAQVSLESIRTTAKTAKNRFMEIISKLIEMFKRVVNNYLDGFNVVEKTAADLDRRLSKVKHSGGEGTFKLVNAGLLYRDDKLVREVTPDVKGLAHFAAVAYPEAVIRFLDGLVKGVLKFDPESGGIEEVKANFEQSRKPLSFLIEKNLADDELPGGYKLDINESGLSIGLSHAKTYSVEPEELPVVTTVKLRNLVRDILLLIQQAKDIRPEVDKIDKAGKKLIEATKRAETKKGTDENKGTYDELSSAVGKIVLEATPRIGEIVGYLLKYARFQLAVVNTQLEIIEAAAKKED